ncbi:putative ATP-dependent helicase Lhr [Phycisphaerae bacterium RAS1]|nr:putative ATP-dependent helicase Lhr [Phycisphaerae bacterium RAS1]
MNVESFLARLTRDRHYRDQIAATRCIEPRAAEYRTPVSALPDRLSRLLTAENIEQLYWHQADALDATGAGENFVVCTGTASGKSLCFHLPVFSSLIDDPGSRALYLFPSKALAYDQLGNLERMVAAAGIGDIAKPGCYDGDTPTSKRPGIRRSASMLLTNPDMLHISVLPYHAKWAGFFARLKYVILDEIHSYRGIFGSHVAGVVRRLQRVAEHYGASPQFLCASATLGNPRELAERLTGRPMRLIDRDGSPRGRRWFVLWNPPWVDDATRISRRSANVEAQRLMEALLEAGAGTIAFGKARVVAELLYKYLQESLTQRKRPDLAARIRPYRGGYLPLERREIEQALFSGRLLGVCSTNALELGIDVGSLDAAILIGFPSTLCSLWQQAGRAGRRQDESLAIFVAYDDPVDQYLMRNAEFIFDKPLEKAVIDPQNPLIQAAQLGCAAFELPLSADDLARFGGNAAEVADAMAEDAKLRQTDGRYFWSSPDFAAAKVDLRTISSATYAIVEERDGKREVLGNVDSISAPELIYPGAVYLHQGESYLVRELDCSAKLARVERQEVDYYTQPVLASECRIVGQRLTEPIRFVGDGSERGRRCFGDVLVKWQTTAFRKFKFYTTELIGQTKADLPPQTINTSGCWFQPPPDALAALRDAGHKAFEALSGIRNLLVVVLPTLAMSDRYDIGGVVDSSQLGVSTIILYDRYEGGVGYCRHGYECASDLLRMAAELLEGCGCENGCPGCVGPPNLRVAIHHDPDLYRGYEFPDKAATQVLLRAWLALRGPVA